MLMHRFFALLLAVLLLLPGCGQRTMTATGTVDLPESSAASQPESSSSPAVSSSPESETSRAAKETESEPAVPSSSAAPTNSTAPAEESSAAAPAEEPSSKASAAASSLPASAAESASAPKKETQSTSSEEVRGVWISYLEFLEMAQNRTESQFSASITEMFETAADYGLNTVFVQVRPFGDALYTSEIFPWSYVLTGEEGNDPGYDPLAVMAAAAKREGLRIEAWINPYRVRATGSSRALSEENPAAEALKNGSGLAIAYEGGVFYNPASAAARDLITEGVVEILENYAVDGIHFDDYFYPTTDAAFDSEEYAAYQSSGGSLSLAAWRRENVTKLVRQVAVAVRKTNPSAVFGISPQARLDVNYNTQYADVEAWAQEGIVDYLCPQIYFGFSHATQPFATRADEWEELVKETGVSLYIGLAAYKCGIADNYAGAGQNEWTENDDLLAEMVAYSRELSGYGGFVLYRYDSVFAPASAVKSHLTAERENLAELF